MNQRVFKEPLQKINERYILIDMKIKSMQNCISGIYKDKKGKAMELIAKLDALSPLKTLTRGYSIAELNGKVVKSANDVKKDLARALKCSYSKTFFEILEHVSEQTWSNVAEDLLWNEAEQLEGIFSEEKIDLYESLVQYAYRHHGIESGTYQNIMRWIHDERKNMDDYLISKNFYEKTVYGFAYEKDGKIKYVDNALQSYVYEKAEKMEQEGYLVTPILSHTYWYEQSRRVSEVLREFRLLLETVYDAEYMTKIKTIRTHKTEISADTFNALLEQIKMSEGEYAFNTLLRYGYAWGVLPLKK